MKEMNFGHKPNLQSYTTSVDPDVVSLYAQEGCKDCYGRGYVITQIGTGRNITIRNDRPIQTFMNRCHCTSKAMKKYG